MMTPCPRSVVRPVSVLALCFGLLSFAPVEAKRGKKEVTEKPRTSLEAESFRGLALRGIGPALMSGRISDIAIHPTDRNTWYVAAGSGGVWKTTNRGTTWSPIFDREASYSIGCLAIDPSNPEVIWVGTGENVSGRHVGFGDGVYRSRDGGKSWTNLGLSNSEHIAKIHIDPRDSNVVLVASEGPLWSPGGERGIFRTEDGGETWVSVLSIGEDTGVTDLVADPRDPEVLYAAAYQRRRQVWSLLAGGRESGLWKSTDGGRSWRRLEKGLPAGKMGKIGLAVSPMLPGVVYATIEAQEEERGFYRSQDSGESWEKRSDYVSGGTGPHYYQEIYASPHIADRVYQMDVWLKVSDDGGKTFQALGEPDKHSDNHALAFDVADPEYLLAGSDGGLYETFDHGTSWRFVANLPLTQFYKIAVDNSEPFYNVVGGTQDNGTQHGPSATLNVHGILNRDWTVPLGADGYACALDPELPQVMYGETQVGSLYRVDLRTGEALGIQPQSGRGDSVERWNWDAPLLISPHSSSRLYFGSHRLWRSDDRGDSWTPISEDLTLGENRYELKMAGRVRSIDDLYDNGAMSQYATLTALAESPLVEGLIYTGSDDGVIAVSEDGGGRWRRVETLPGGPARAFVNELTASPMDPDMVFAAVDRHKTGDFQPYLLKSVDRGRTWSSIAGDLPDRHLVWSIAQDHERKELLFAGTEFGIFFTVDGGDHWLKLEGGVPTIAFRDLVIQRRESDLVGGSFGRGIYILDDYSPLRQVSEDSLEQEAHLFPVRDAWWYVPSTPLAVRDRGYQGSSFFRAQNPPFGALFTVYLKDTSETAKDLRRKQEKELEEQGQDIPFPGWDVLEEEALEKESRWVLTVKDVAGRVIRRLSIADQAGFQRIAWDFRWPAPDPVPLQEPGPLAPWASPDHGPLVVPGTYRVELARLEPLGLERIAGVQEFKVRLLENSALPVEKFSEMAEFQRRTSELYRQVQGAVRELGRGEERLQLLEKALLQTPAADLGLMGRIRSLRRELYGVRKQLVRDRVRSRLRESSIPTVEERISEITFGHWETRSGPTETHRQSLEIASERFDDLLPQLQRLLEQDLREIEDALEAAGAPWTAGRSLPRPF